jgi:threonine dehydrogenase-like Zn-dependent dehydrogenase
MGLEKTTRIIVSDFNPQRLDFIHKKYPSVMTLKANEEASNNLSQLLNGDKPTIVIDATGNKESMVKCVDYVAHGGTIVYVGLFIGDIIIYDPDFHRKEITLKASRNALPKDFVKIIELLRTGRLNMDGYVTHHLQFNSLEVDFTNLYLPEANVIKAVVSY